MPPSAYAACRTDHRACRPLPHRFQLREQARLIKPWCSLDKKRGLRQCEHTNADQKLFQLGVRFLVLASKKPKSFKKTLLRATILHANSAQLKKWRNIMPAILVQMIWDIAAFSLIFSASAEVRPFPVGFHIENIKIADATIHVRVGGKGPAIVMFGTASATPAICGRHLRPQWSRTTPSLFLIFVGWPALVPGERLRQRKGKLSTSRQRWISLTCKRPIS